MWGGRREERSDELKNTRVFGNATRNGNSLLSSLSLSLSRRCRCNFLVADTILTNHKHLPLYGSLRSPLLASLVVAVAVSAYKKTGQLSIKTATRVTEIEREGGAGLLRLSLQSTKTNTTSSLVTPAVIICTGGFGNDKGQDSLLKEVRMCEVRSDDVA